MTAGDPYRQYERGLQRLKLMLPSDPQLLADVYVFEHRLLENIRQARLYGDSDSYTRDRAQIIGELSIIAVEYCGRTFTELCHEAMVSLHDTPPAPPYYLSAALINILQQITTLPGYHLVLAEAGFGKTALIEHLARQRRPAAVSYSFSGLDGRHSVEAALQSLREQLRALGNLPSAYNRSFSYIIQEAVGYIEPWSVLRQRNWPKFLILLDGIDECERYERGLFDELLTAQLPGHVGVVVTMRPAVCDALFSSLPGGHPLCHTAPRHMLSPLDIGDIRRLLAERRQIYTDTSLARRIRDLSGGHPAAIIWLARYLDDALHERRDPVEVLKKLPRFHTYRDLFAHELDRMERHCRSEEERGLLHGLLGALAVARQPLSPAQLAAVLGEPPEALYALAQRLQRFFQMDDGGLAFSHPQFIGYLEEHNGWPERLSHAQRRWDAWLFGQEAADPLVAEIGARIRDELVPALRGQGLPWPTEGDHLLSPAIRTREGWLAAVSRAWEQAEARDEGPADPTELLLCALLLVSWPHAPSALPPRGSESADAGPALLLTDQLRGPAQPPGGLELRSVEALLELLAGEPADEAMTFDEFVVRVSELGQAWRAEPTDPQRRFAQILRLITRVVRRHAAASPLPSPRANLLDALSALAPAIQDRAPGSVEGICRLVDTFIKVLP